MILHRWVLKTWVVMALFYATPRMSRNQIGSDGSLSQGWTESTDSLLAGLHWVGQRQSKSETKLDFPRRLENMKAQKKTQTSKQASKKKHRKKHKKTQTTKHRHKKKHRRKHKKKPQTAKHDFRKKSTKKPIETSTNRKAQTYPQKKTQGTAQKKKTQTSKHTHKK